MIVLAVAAAALFIGIALGWALAGSSRTVVGLREDNVRLRTELSHLQQTVPDKLALLEGAQADLKATFDSLAGAALRASTDEFLKLADQKLSNVQKDAIGDLDRRQMAFDELITPIRETLAKVDEKLSESDRARVQTGAEIASLLRTVHSEQDRLREETQQLVRALRTPSVRGRWGEIQLRRVVEMAGMLEYCDFDEQPTLIAEVGRQRPDLIVRLPGGRTIVVDAKVPLEAYLDAQDLDDEAARNTRLKDHARQVRDHLTKLGAKSYWEQVQPSPEFVVMFLPGEQLFHAALRQDAALIDHGVQSRVYPASPITLIALLQVVAQGWRHERLARNAEEVQSLGQELHARVTKMTEYLDTLRMRLDGTVRAFNDVVGSYETRVLVTARRFKTLGATSGSEIEPLQAIDAVPRAMQSVDAPALPDEAMIEGEAVEKT